MRTPVNLILSSTSIGLGAANSLTEGGDVDFGTFPPWWVHGVVLDGGRRAIFQCGRRCNSPLKVATYIFREDLDIT